MHLNPFGKRRERFRAPSDRAGAAFQELDMFLDAALVWVEPSLLSVPRSRALTRIFFVGAADALSLRYSLGESGLRALAGKALARVGFSADEMQHPVQARSSDWSVENARAEGRGTMEAWLGGDTDAPMRLAQLAHEWKRYK